MKTYARRLTLAAAAMLLFAGCATWPPKHTPSEYRFLAGDIVGLQGEINELASNGWQLISVAPTGNASRSHDAIVTLRKPRK